MAAGRQRCWTEAAVDSCSMKGEVGATKDHNDSIGAGQMLRSIETSVAFARMNECEKG